MNFSDYWDKNWADVPGADRTDSEEVWNDAKKDAWASLFQVVSDHADMADRDLIKLLEAARDADGAGPS